MFITSGYKSFTDRARLAISNAIEAMEYVQPSTLWLNGVRGLWASVRAIERTLKDDPEMKGKIQRYFDLAKYFKELNEEIIRCADSYMTLWSLNMARVEEEEKEKRKYAAMQFMWNRACKEARKRRRRSLRKQARKVIRRKKWNC